MQQLSKQMRDRQLKVQDRVKKQVSSVRNLPRVRRLARRPSTNPSLAHALVESPSTARRHWLLLGRRTNVLASGVLVMRNVCAVVRQQLAGGWVVNTSPCTNCSLGVPHLRNCHSKAAPVVAGHGEGREGVRQPAGDAGGPRHQRAAGGGGHPERRQARVGVHQALRRRVRSWTLFRRSSDWLSTSRNHLSMWKFAEAMPLLTLQQTARCKPIKDAFRRWGTLFTINETIHT